MSTAIPPRPRVVGVKHTFFIVASQFNAQYVQGLIDHATEELHALSPAASVTVQKVPGAFEIPIVVRELASHRNADAIIAMGVILQGETSHAENLSRSVTDALQRIALEHGVPVIHVVLSFSNEAQARERCLEDKINRGTAAARTAVEIVNVMADLRTKARHG
jgi:6,7-dimethyl-8-ribityllumazine synthase